jgi:lipopolysaccharide transport system ATP-binding protein
VSRPAIKVEGIGKLYRLEHAAAGSRTFRDLLTDMANAPLRRFRQLRGTDESLEDFWALKDVSFEARPGEVIGIIGRNGAGKSTLLKILSRIVEPTEGMVTMRGRISSLLEVGTGFHPELSGRENIYLNGSILGMKKKEITARFDDIVEFAEISKFLDTPVKRYSSGMYVRLAFAVAAHLDPEILIVDEVLAVGDAEFQKKCLGKIRDVSLSGERTVLFVSHNMAAVTTLCQRVIELKSGQVNADGDTQSVVSSYLSAKSYVHAEDGDLSAHPGRAAGLPVILTSARLREESGNPVSAIKPGQRVTIELSLSSAEPLRNPKISMAFENSRGERIFAIATYLSPDSVSRITASSCVRAKFQFPALIPGQYYFEVTLAGPDGNVLDRVDDAIRVEVMQDDYLGSTHPYFPEMGLLLVKSSWSEQSVVEEVS